MWDCFKRVDDNLMALMFERFRSEPGPNAAPEATPHVDALNVMLGIVLMAKLVQPKKITLIFQLCDEDDDGVLSAD